MHHGARRGISTTDARTIPAISIARRSPRSRWHRPRGRGVANCLHRARTTIPITGARGRVRRISTETWPPDKAERHKVRQWLRLCRRRRHRRACRGSAASG